jgi:PEP-CTERM motif
MRFHWLIGAAALALLMQVSPGARAGLIGNGTNTVSALFFLGAASAPAPPYTNPAPSEIEDYQGPMGPTNSPPPTIPVHFLEGALDLSTIDVGDTTITITNLAPSGTPFCAEMVPPACPDRFTGFAFAFSSGVDITGVSVDPMSAADFLPNTTAPHDGVELLSPTDIIVDLTGDAPATGDQLILDATTGPVSSVPEPQSLALLAIGLVGLLAIARRARRRSSAASLFS